jgi:zinc protease
MNLERKLQPRINPVELLRIPEAGISHLKNGVPVYMINAGTEELMRIEFIFNAGQVVENFPLVASTTNTMLPEGSVNYSAKDINSAFDFYGAFINPFNQKDSSGVTVFLLNKHLERILDLCQELIFRPVFPDDELKNLQLKRLQAYLMNREKVQVLANDKFLESIFGSMHPYGKLITLADFENVTRTMLKDFHSDYYSVSNMTIIIAGNIPDNILSILNRYFGEFYSSAKTPVNRDIKIISKPDKKEFIEKKDAVQSAIRIGSATINKKHKDFNGLMILDTILGGYFGSRLMKNIREEKGYTYGISSALISLQKSGYKIIATEVGKKYTQKTLDEIYKEIRLLQTTFVEPKELDVVRSYMTGEMVRIFDGPFALAESFKAVWEYGLDNTYYYELAEKIKTINPDEIIELARTYYNIDDLFEITAGSK